MLALLQGQGDASTLGMGGGNGLDQFNRGAGPFAAARRLTVFFDGLQQIRHDTLVATLEEHWPSYLFTRFVTRFHVGRGDRLPVIVGCTRLDKRARIA